MKNKYIMVTCVMISLLISSAKVSIAESPTYKTAKDYIVEYSELFGTDANVLLKVAECESGLNQNAKGDSNKAVGIYQYWQDTWNRFEKLYGEKLDINSYQDQAKLTAFIFAKYPQYKTQWTAYRAIQKGGVYSFYSNKLGKYFVARCKL